MVSPCAYTDNPDLDDQDLIDANRRARGGRRRGELGMKGGNGAVLHPRLSGGGQRSADFGAAGRCGAGHQALSR